MDTGLLILLWANFSISDKRVRAPGSGLLSDKERHKAIIDFSPDSFGEFCD